MSFKSGDESILPKSEGSEQNDTKTQNDSIMNQTYNTKTPSKNTQTNTQSSSINFFFLLRSNVQQYNYTN